MTKSKRSRNLWLFSGIVWAFILFRGLSIEGPSLYLIVNGVTSILCFIIAYIIHKEI